MKKPILILPIVLLLASCVATTSNELRSDPSGKIEFSSDLGFDDVYELVLGKTNDCWKTGGIFTLETTINNKRQQGTITRLLSSMGMDMAVMTVDIAGNAGNSTNVTVFYGFPIKEFEAIRVIEWLNGRTDC